MVYIFPPPHAPASRMCEEINNSVQMRMYGEIYSGHRVVNSLVLLSNGTPVAKWNSWHAAFVSPRHQSLPPTYYSIKVHAYTMCTPTFSLAAVSLLFFSVVKFADLTRDERKGTEHYSQILRPEHSNCGQSVGRKEGAKITYAVGYAKQLSVNTTYECRVPNSRLQRTCFSAPACSVTPIARNDSLETTAPGPPNGISRY